MATAEAGSGSGGSSGARPDVEVQREELRSLMTTNLRAGESWYLVDMSWFRKWKKYVGFNSWERDGAGDPSRFPGPVDNSGLFSDPETQTLKERLVSALHFVLVPPEGWNKLVMWYGCMEGQQPIVRKVVEYGRFSKHLEVEVYLLELKLCVCGDFDNLISRHFSQADTIGTIEKEIRKVFNIPDAKAARLWCRYGPHTYGRLKKLDKTVQDVGLRQGQIVVIEVKSEDGTWPGYRTQGI
ncbi:ubiquitin carboxyl-terminal hydrolase 4-like [Melopsittacus undulatus]|uniref:ubiquitinyl hydrolase 1 n=1 Tax=Melopsittacus undulatus TaxID=13146 RepID=A0A8C6JVN8_MELUD|nr:ubiquitin carboxyl-terminal hydrolase 4-like [Melopsittacus undulatus]